MDLARILKIGKGKMMISLWTDASFACHQDMKSHTGIVLSVGGAIVGVGSLKQKLVTKSSTEAELVAASDTVPWNVWMSNFLIDQGYNKIGKILYQDNESAIKLEQNGRASSSGRTRHINIKYFFTKDITEREKINIRYCPTDQMIGDFFTKPLQGCKFRQFRDTIMGMAEIDQATIEVD